VGRCRRTGDSSTLRRCECATPGEWERTDGLERTAAALGGALPPRHDHASYLRIRLHRRSEHTRRSPAPRRSTTRTASCARPAARTSSWSTWTWTTGGCFLGRRGLLALVSSSGKGSAAAQATGDRWWWRLVVPLGRRGSRRGTGVGPLGRRGGGLQGT
jgi:hypothetical protein